MFGCPACKETFDTQRALLYHRLSFHGWTGAKVPYRGGEVRVMAIADGWAMCRFPGARPFVVPLKELLGD